VKKRGRPEFKTREEYSDIYKITESLYPELSCKRSFQNRCYELKTIKILIRLTKEEEKEHLKTLYDFNPENTSTYKLKSSLLTELGRFEDEELIFLAAKKIASEMKEFPNKTISEWRKDLRKFRLNLFK